jgi:RNase P subunit RPR2
MASKTPHRLINGIEHKICTRCQQWKPVDEYYRDKKSADGLRYYCKECNSNYRKDYYKSEDGHKVCLDIGKRYYDRNKRKCISAVQKCREKLKELENNDISETLQLGGEYYD